MNKGKKQNDEKRTYSVGEFARIVGLGKNAAYSAVHRKEIQSIRIGGRFLIPKAVLDRLLEGN